MASIAVNPTADTWLDESGVSPNGGTNNFVIGWTAVLGVANALIQFNFTGVLARPVSAILALRCTIGAASARGLTFAMLEDSFLPPAADPWVEAEADWDEYKTGGLWTGLGGDIDTDGDESGGLFLPTTAPQTINYDMVLPAQNAFDRGLQTLCLFGTTGAGGSDGRATYSSRTAISNKPLLTVTWNDPAGGPTWTGRYGEFTGRIEG